MISDNSRRSLRTLVEKCVDILPESRVLIVSDPKTMSIGNEIHALVSGMTAHLEHETIPMLTMHGQEPPEVVAEKMLLSTVIFGLTTFSLAHTSARLRASERGAMYLSLPDYSWELLDRKAMNADFRQIFRMAEKIAAFLTNADKIIVETTAGTSLRLSARGRKANAAPGWCWEPGSIASPPDAEVNVAVVEELTEGLLVVDGSIPCGEIGLVKDHVRLKISGGRVVDIEGDRAALLESIFDKKGDPKTRIVGEFGIGLNPMAELCGIMLEDEGCLGTVHFGIGSNATIGGKNSVAFHLDHVIRMATVFVDGQKLIDNGKLLVRA